jgi:hypothetical protein
MAFYSNPALSEASPGPQSGSIGLSGTVPAKPPTVAATITTPVSGKHFGTSPVDVAGTCPANTLVEIFKNDIFAGSVECDSKGNFNLQVDLLIGQNTLFARVYDALNQAGPDSNQVTVFYDALPTQSAPLSLLNFGDKQLLLNTDAVYRGVFPDQTLNVPITILGGFSPYAVNVQWGDNSNKIIPRGDNLVFNASHAYKKPGTYQITLQATDSHESVAFLTVAAIVNGSATVAAAATPNTPTSKLLVLWPMYASATSVVVSFWLGERREKHLLKAYLPS